MSAPKRPNPKILSAPKLWGVNDKLLDRDHSEREVRLLQEAVNLLQAQVHQLQAVLKQRGHLTSAIQAQLQESARRQERLNDLVRAHLSKPRPADEPAQTEDAAAPTVTDVTKDTA